MTDVVLTGPVTLPGDGTPIAGCPVRILLIAGSPRDPGDTGTAAVLGEYATETDADGDFTVTIPAIDADFYPQGAFYAVTVGGTGRFKGYVRKIQPTTAGTFRFTDPAIGGTDLLPPEFVQIEPLGDDVTAAVADYFATNPIDVTTEVDAALAGHPPLFVDNNLSELTDTQATARLNIGAASDTEMAADHTVFDNRLGSLELAESTDPALRQSTLDGAGLVVAPNFALVEFDVVDGVVTFNVSGTGAGSGGGAFQPLDSDLTAIAALTTTTYGRSLLTLANLAALRTTLGPTGTPSSSTYLRGDGTWATPAGGGGGSGAVDSVNGAIGDVVLGASDVGAQPVDSDLTAIAALSTTSFGRSLLTQADAAAARTTLGLGSISTLSTITSSNITDGTIVDADISGTAAVAYGKLALTGAILNADLAGSIAYSKLSLTGAVLNADLAGAIAYSKLNLTGNIVAADFSDVEIAALAGLTSAADRLPYFTGSGTASLATFTAAGRALVDDADAAAQRTTLGLGTAATTASTAYDASGAAAAAQAASQPLDGELTAIAGLTSAADRLPYFSGSGTASLATFTSAGRALVDDADASTQRTTLGLGSLSTVSPTGTPDGTKFLRDDNSWQALSGSADQLGLTPTAVKTANYTAAAGDLVPIDTSSANVTVTLPSAPADGSVVGVVYATLGLNTATVQRGGTDHFDTTSGITSETLDYAGHALIFQYKSGVWYRLADGLPYSVAKTRFGPNIIQKGYIGVGDGSIANSLPPGADGLFVSADSTQSVGVKYRSPFYQRKTGATEYFAPDDGVATASSTLSQNRVYFIPLTVQFNYTVDRLAVSVTTQQASGVIRLGIFNSSNGRPSTLVVEPGSTVDASTTGDKELTLSQAMTPGLYWLAVVGQGAGGIVIRGIAPDFMAMVGSTTLSDQTTGATTLCWIQASVTGAFSTINPATPTPQTLSNMPRPILRVT